MKTKQLLFVICFLAYATSSFGLAKETHESINLTISDLAIKKFSMDLYLKNILKIENGVKEQIKDSKHCPNEILQRYEEGCTIGNLLRWGGRKEDEADFRSFRHFHNPLEPWEGAGLKHSDLGRSSIIWAQSRDQSYGKYSWQDVRGYYYSALTSTEITARGDYFSETFRGLGQLMHLIQDASVPLHTRDDIHIIFSYEGWLETLRNEEPETFFNWVSNPIGYDESILSFPPNPLAPIPIAKIADTDQYRRDNLDIDTAASTRAGIAEYSNAHLLQLQK